MNKSKKYALSILTLAVTQALSMQPQAAEFDRLGASQTDFGGAGLLQMPTARMADTGEFSANYRDNDQYRRWSISLQPYDWLETTIRYTDVRTRLYSNDPAFSGNQSYKDKGIDVKLRMLEEGMWLPQMAIGVRDFAGTGLFDGEYLVASKRWGDLDFTLGMGWGYMGERGNISNPFCSLSDKNCTRSGFSGVPGNFEVGNLFRGSTAIFGGVEYQTPWQPLRLKLEYDGNDYSHEFAGNIKANSPFNIGAVYRVTDLLDTHLSYERGNTLMWGVTLRTNFNSMRNLQIDESREKVQTNTAATTQQTDWQQVASRLESNAGWINPTIYSDDKQVHVLAEQNKYRNSDEANARAAAIVANATSASVKTLTLTRTREQMPISEQNINLQSVREAADRPLGQDETRQTVATKPSLPQGVVERTGDRQRFNWSWAPHIAQSFGGPENFYMYQVALGATSDLAITNHLWASAGASLNVVNNYDQFNYKTPPQDSSLPRVRTWIREYITSSDLLLTNLQLTEMDKLSDSIYWQAYGGYLEMMYAGVGSEVLYRPFGKSWAIGMDANYVRQRDWNNTMKLADYTVGTGHITGYWNLPYIDNTLLKLSVGRYLAKDIGATIDLSRKFDSGVVAGAFATFTDVSANDYGEGSFTKGFYINIPFDLLLVKPTTSTGAVSWIPLTRDGGQALSKKYGLYTLTDGL